MEQPQLTNEDAHVLTMEMFNEAFTRDDVINILAADKANGMASTYAYVPVTVTEAEIQEFYAKIEAIVARAPALSYYFSNYYWWTRDDDDYYDDLISLKLVPTSVMKNTNDKEEALAAWALVKDACDSSRYWTNEGSLSQQFLCHFYGEIAHRAGLCEAVGDWDLEPIRPNTGLFQFAINKCNPHD
ncbi:MAG: DUF2599 domain-containing protein [Bacteroides fragilis]